MLNFKEMYDLGIQAGIAADPRGTKKVKQYLDRVQKEFENLKPADKNYFEKERLTNPYFFDSRMHSGDAKAPIKRILAGIDADAGEVLLATQLSERGKNIDAVVVHHPLGGSLATLNGVMDMVVEVYEALGVPVHLAEKYMEERIVEVGRGLHPYNHYQIIDMARLLGVPVMNMHTPTDNMVHKFLQEFLDKRKPETVGDLMDALMEIPEYQEAKKRGAGPMIFSGSPKHKVGKFILEMTGGTEPSNKIYTELSRVGISTVVGMHMQKDSREKAGENNLNVVVAGHMSSDSLGMNLYLDELEKKGIEVVPCGGLIRVSRVKKK